MTDPQPTPLAPAIPAWTPAATTEASPLPPGEAIPVLPGAGVEPPGPVHPTAAPTTATAVAVLDGLQSVTCPACGTQSHVDPGQREASAFCRVCDYPLFWARERITVVSGSENTEASLRRLPGTGGRTALAAIVCPVCSERNQPSAVLCQRCGSELRPKPVVLAPPAPLPLPPPVVEVEEQRSLWPWIIAGITAALIIAVVILLIVYND